MKSRRSIVSFGLSFASALLAGLALSGAAAAEGPASRYVSLRHDSVNVRAGPGQDYPIRWTYQRQGLPVLVLRDYDNWRLVRDFEGSEGWVHASGLTRRRTVVVMGSIRVLRADPQDGARPVARLEPGVVGRLEKCERSWCRLNVQGHAGWLKQQEMWGVRPGEKLD